MNVRTAMYFVLIVLSILLLLISSEAEAGRYTDQYAGQRLQHTIVGGVIGGLAYSYYPPTWNQKYRWLAAIGLPLAIGLSYETIFDHNTFDILDVVEWGVGGTVGAVLVWKF